MTSERLPARPAAPRLPKPEVSCRPWDLALKGGMDPMKDSGPRESLFFDARGHDVHPGVSNATAAARSPA